MREAKRAAQTGSAPPLGFDADISASGVHIEELGDEDVNACPHCGGPVDEDGHYINDDDAGLDDVAEFDEGTGDSDAFDEYDDPAAEIVAREVCGWTAEQVRRL